MGKLENIKKELGSLYDEYVANSKKIKKAQAENAAKYIIKLIGIDKDGYKIAADELIRFHALVTEKFIDIWFGDSKPSQELVDNFVKSFVDKKAGLKQNEKKSWNGKLDKIMTKLEINGYEEIVQKYKDINLNSTSKQSSSNNNQKYISELNNTIKSLEELINSINMQTEKNTTYILQILEIQTKLLEMQNSNCNKDKQKDKNGSNNDFDDKQKLKDKIKELDAKLKNAYDINNREASLEAEKIKNNISKSLSLSYRNWLEYEKADVTENNFLSLQAIIRRIFRVLSKNDINFKEK